MTGFEILLFVHILASMLWIGGAVVGTMLGMSLHRSGDARQLGRFCLAFASIAGPVFGGSGGVVLLTGIGMVAMDGGPSFSDTWVSIGFAGWLVSTVVGAALAGRSWYRVSQLLAEDETRGLDAVEPTYRRALRWTWLDITLRVAIVFVMVWRPT